MGKNVLDKDGFDEWSKTYDRDVLQTEEENVYPFAAYSEVIDEVYKQVIGIDAKSVLDLGFGTATLTSRFYEDGLDIAGVDFSSEMVEIAKTLMPKAKLLTVDLELGVPDSLREDYFDAVVMTYSIHHLETDKQVALIKDLFKQINEGGILAIGDVLTKTRADMDNARLKDQDYWDDEESYIVLDEFTALLADFQIDFYKKSYCSGVIVLKKK